MDGKPFFKNGEGEYKAMCMTVEHGSGDSVQ